MNWMMIGMFALGAITGCIVSYIGICFILKYAGEQVMKSSEMALKRKLL